MNTIHNNYGILGCGHALPKQILSNADFIKRGLDTSDEWIVERTGIRTRRIISEGESTSVLATNAAQMALEHAGVSATQLGLIIVATSTADFDGFPSVACQVQYALKARPIPAFDLSAACTGFNYALSVAHQHLKTGFCEYALVIGADSLSTIVDWNDRGTCILFGDGAGAVVLGPCRPEHGILSSLLFSDGSEADILKVENHHIKMNGQAVFKSAVRRITPSLRQLFDSASVSATDISYIIPHQANLRIINHIHQDLEISPDRVLSNLDKYGNTSAASIPIVLSESAHQGKFSEGNLLALIGFGAGFTWGANLIKWSLS